MAWRSFTLIFLACALILGGGTLVLGKLPAASRCRPTSAGDAFVAYCRGIGDYEHAAYAFGLEPAALAALGRAKIVSLGNSRAQIAFSTPATRLFSREHGPIYLAGFGFDEGSPFALRILKRAGAHPRAVIVNADPFFTERLSPPAARIATEPWRAAIGALRNKAALDLRAWICERAPVRALCRGSRTAVHRASADGGWAWERAAVESAAIDARPGAPLPPPSAAAIARARAFLSALDLPARCLFVTAAPNSLTNAEDFAAMLAAALGAPLILPRLAGLRTVDGSHLDPDSAERWSASFLEAATPRLRACLDDGGRG